MNMLAICGRNDMISTHCGLDKMAAILQTTLSNAFSWISIKISLKFVPKGPINNIPALVKIMAWRRPGDKPLSEPMMVRFLTHICITRPQWANHVKGIPICMHMFYALLYLFYDKQRLIYPCDSMSTRFRWDNHMILTPQITKHAQHGTQYNTLYPGEIHCFKKMKSSKASALWTYTCLLNSL